MPDRSRSHRRLLVINAVGLTASMIGEDTPSLRVLRDEGFARPMATILPAVTCSVQSTMLTGEMPERHGIVGNGWYFRDLAEVMFWKQSNHLVGGEKVFQTARRRDSSHTTAKLFWWYNMYADVDWSVTPRPSYPADGRKLPDLYSEPSSMATELQSRHGGFPLFNFWGPTADIRSSSWIADASLSVWREYRPSLLLVYLPHLDYGLQRLGPDDAAIRSEIRRLDHEAGKLIHAARDSGAEILVVSEYGITEVHRPVHINRALREQGFLRTRREITGWESLDCGASRAFAVADHQVAQIYLKNPADQPHVRQLVERLEGVERVLDKSEQRDFGISHERSGDLVAVSGRDAWFTYYFWLDDALAPDYARTVDIHRKPGYDPAELFVDPQLRLPALRIACRLLQKKLGCRYLMDVIGLDADIVRGSHGRLPVPDRMQTDAPVFICSDRTIERDTVHVRDVRNLMLQLQFGSV